MSTRLPAGTHITRGFSKSSRYAFLYTGGVTGAGRGDDGTQLEVAYRTATAGQRALVPKERGKTNPLYVVRTTDKTGVEVMGVTIDAGDQGCLYNGLRVEKTDRPLVTQVRVRNVPGDSDVPPGETFGINLWQAKEPVVSHTEVDGRGVGASGLGLNSCSGGSTTSFTAHDHPHCKAIALWQHKGGHEFVDVQSLNNAFGYGFERCTGTYRLVRNKFRGSKRADIHLASDTGRCKVVIEDPDLKPGQRIKVLLSKTEMGKPNKQRAEDVTLTVKGKERRDLLVFVTKA